jgi:hypothetical protein
MTGAHLAAAEMIQHIGAWDGKLLVILLGGGTKRRQQSDIESALRHWRSYKARKAAGRTKRNGSCP